MARGIGSAYQAEYAKDKFSFAHLIKIELSVDVHLTDSAYKLTHDSATYTPLGGLISMGSVKESAILQIGRVDITVSGLNSTVLNAALNEVMLNKEVTIYRAIINVDTGAYIDTPREIFNGTISNYTIQDGNETSAIALQVASNWANFMQINGRVTNSTSQSNTKLYNTSDTFSQDYGFQYASAAIADIKWGKE